MLIFAVIIGSLFLGTFAYGSLRGAPWIPTWSKDVQRFINLAEIKPSQKFYDLGCGDGRLVCAAARAGADAIGFEVALLPYILANIRAFLTGENARIRYKDFWYYDLADADVVYFFLMPEKYPKIKGKFEKELKPGTKVIAYVWPIDGWQPVKIDTTPGQPSLYLYMR